MLIFDAGPLVVKALDGIGQACPISVLDHLLRGCNGYLVQRQKLGRSWVHQGLILEQKLRLHLIFVKGHVAYHLCCRGALDRNTLSGQLRVVCVQRSLSFNIGRPVAASTLGKISSDIARGGTDSFRSSAHGMQALGEAG